jgi:hypothetical protein
MEELLMAKFYDKDGNLVYDIPDNILILLSGKLSIPIDSNEGAANILPNESMVEIVGASGGGLSISVDSNGIATVMVFGGSTGSFVAGGNTITVTNGIITGITAN